ncbi:sacsin N-terminal ATP-binding-like domain-containing protein [Gordonia sp. (in: high G+C Gram-positive bacteria)]|uniref:sacsin N-terminal ATP-binding-like domain-containing protein n=1 Tax=Gordonia sp. (in: high G+C Gram-positive bacteria) TaxID=84139 RepID=UPI003526D3DF
MDPFGTAALRAATLAAWRDSPTRLAEDAAAEDDLRQIGYRDRWFTELAANAADAALAAGVPGRLVVRADAAAGLVRVGNTGAPLTVDGVRALTALRVSPKGGHREVGRFGVGFRATSFADRVDLLSSSGSITFDRARTADALDPALRGHRVPGQRLAWPLDEAPSTGLDSEVVLHVRDAARVTELLDQARAEAPDLLLELTALGEIDVAGRVLTRRERAGRVEIIDDGRVVATWLESTAGGHRWLVPVDDAGIHPLTGDVLRAPTPTQIPLSLPARLITDLPLTPDRRGLHPDADAAAAAAGYTGLLLLVPAEQRHLLVPAPAFAASGPDGVLREAVLAELAATRWVPSSSGDEPLAPERTWVLRGLTADLAELLGEVIAPLAAPESSDGAAARTLLRLGARETSLAEVADLLAGVVRPARWWARLYAALDPLTSTREAAEELGALPVPRADGRTRRGVRGLAVVDLPRGADIPVDWIPVIDPAAYHPLLDRLGLERLSIGDVLAHPALQQRMDAADDDELEELADTVLRLVAADESAGSALPGWLGALPVRAADGSDRPVDELLLPGSPLHDVLYDDAGLGLVDPAVVEAYGAGPLRRLGAGWGFAPVYDDLPTAPDHDLDGEEDWWDFVGVPPERLIAVRDLDLVDPDRWRPALALLAADPEIAAQFADRDGYLVWWLRRHAEIDGRPLREFRAPGDPRWAGLFDPLDHPAADVLAPLTAGAGPDDADDAAAWLAALADPGRAVAPGVAARAHAALVAARAAGRIRLDDIEPPEALRTMTGTVTREPVVVDQPWLLPVVPRQIAVLAGPHPEPSSAAAFAELADAPLASETVVAQVVSPGRPLDADAPEAVEIAAATGWDLSGLLLLHDRLDVAVLADGEERRVTVPRWRDAADTLHLGSVRWTR